MIASQTSGGPEPFGKYLLDREIARGGMARVYLGRLRGLGGFEKRLVVKQILPSLASDPRFVEMFVEEAKTLVQMSHPHIVPVYELGVVEGVYFLAMEYVEGATLADVLDDGPLDPAEAAHAGAQICDALSYAHERFSIVHRDVTPRNVMIDAVGHCRLLDFGIAAPATDEAGGQLFGTPGYLSPEQARGEAIAAASDLFSLGAVLWHALAGAPPEATRTIDAARALRPGDLRPALVSSSERGAEIDRELAAIVARALEPDPALRFPDARSMGRALRGWLASRHPEGVGPELGARADRARARRELRPAGDQPATSEGGTAKIARTPSTNGAARARIETLAQSRALDEIIEGAAPLARSSDPEPVAGGGTVPLPGRSSRHDAVATPAAARGRHDAIAPPASAPTPVRSRAPLALAVTATALALGALALWPRGADERELRVAAPPREATPGPTPVGGGAGEGPLAVPPPPDPSLRPVAPEPVAPEPVAVEPVGIEPVGTEPPVAPTASEDPQAETARRAVLAITTVRGWASVEIDGRTLGTTPIRRATIAPGPHTLVARNDVLGREARARIELHAGERVHAVVDLDAATITVRDR